MISETINRLHAVVLYCIANIGADSAYIYSRILTRYVRSFAR